MINMLMGWRVKSWHHMYANELAQTYSCCLHIHNAQMSKASERHQHRDCKQTPYFSLKLDLKSSAAFTYQVQH